MNTQSIKKGLARKIDADINPASSRNKILAGNVTPFSRNFKAGPLSDEPSVNREHIEHKQAQIAQQGNGELLRLFAENLPFAFAVLDKDMRYVAVSERFLTDHLISDSNPIGRSHYQIFEGIADDWSGHFKRCLAGETVCYEDARATSGVEAARVRWEIKPWFDGKEVGGVFLFSEIIAENARSEKELHLAAMVFHDCGEAMMIMDADNRIVAVNPAFERITGYRNSEVIGENSRILNPDQHGNLDHDVIDQEVRTIGQWQGERLNRRRNGEVFSIRTTINTLFNLDGSVYRRLALFSDITQKKEMEQLIWQQANLDSLTGLPNRRLFRENLSQQIQHAHRTNSSLALMFLDLDGFKHVNDTLGHDIGDILLEEAARRLKACVRRTDHVARLGGDEFTVIVSNLPDSDSVERIALNILKKLSEPFRLGDEIAYVSASIGITLCPGDAVEIEELLKNADQAMYAAKQQGRNQLCFFTRSMQDAAQAKRHLINDLRDAVERSEFHLVYQPIIELATGIIRKAEALIRWHHPSRGLVSPAEFISVAEETGMIHEIGEWVFREAARQALQWRKLFHPQFKVSINMSPAQFRRPCRDNMALTDHLQLSGLSGEGLVIEITEGLLLDASPDVTAQLQAFREKGIEIALDDFGTGYSSLSYLKKFDIDYLKIDQSFVRNLSPHTDDMALCEAIVAMAHKLGIKVIAEGVETAAQRSLLTTIGCDYTQGYLYSKPVSAEKFHEFMRSRTNIGSDVFHI